MAKKCSICGNTIKFLDQNLKFKDGYVGQDCYNKVGLSESFASITWADEHFIGDVQELIENNMSINPKEEKEKAKQDLKDEKNKTKQEYKDLVSFYKNNDSLNFGDYFFSDKKRTFFKQKSFLSFETFEYSYDDILEISQDSTTTQKTNVKKKHGVTRAITGGVVAGPIGAVVGASSGHDKVSTDSSTDYYLNILLNNNKTVTISSQSAAFINNINNKLLNIISQNKVNTDSKDSNLDDLRELKSLLDDGILTEEEFSLKKKKILDI